MGVTQYVLIGFIVLLLIAYPIIMSRRNKNQNQKMEEQANSLKKGDEIITSAGVYGKIIEVKQEGEAKKVVIETGNAKNKSYLTIDAYCIYSVLNKETKEPVKEEKKAKKDDEKEEKVAEEVKTEEVKEEKPEEVKEDVKEEPVKEEKKPKAQKKSNKKSK